METVFSPKVTDWKLSYDGRNKEPINLPVKFPLLLAQGVEGIAVGLNSKILPHNFSELCDASVAYLRGEPFKLYPDFPTGGSIDASRYNDGERGGMVKVRAKIGKLDSKTLVITEIPYGTSTGKLIDSIIKAGEKGKIKIRKIDDNTATDVEIRVHLQAGVSSDKTIDALYAFTDCEQSIYPNCCVIHDKKPEFLTVSRLLQHSADHTMHIFHEEFLVQLGELREQLFFTSLEKIFIEQRIYKDKEFEDSTTQDDVIMHVGRRLEPFAGQLVRGIRPDDILKLLDIKMVQITKFDSRKADDNIAAIRKKIEEVEYNIGHLTQFTIDWFEYLKKKYGEHYQRRTEIRNFETIVAAKVAEANEKLYINRNEGFIGTGLKKDEYVCNCSDMDDIIIFFKDGKYKVVKVADKLFVGSNVLHLDVFRKNDKRTIYNAIYRDGKAGAYYVKRFAVFGVSRDKEYDLTQGKPGSRVLYFTANPNGEAEIIRVILKPNPRLKKTTFEHDFSRLAVKGRQSMGNLLTKNDVHKIALKQKGGSTLGGRHVWFDPDVLRLNYDGRGNYLGEFAGDDAVLVITRSGDYYTTTFDSTNHFEGNLLHVMKHNADTVWSAILWDADQQYYYAKRFPLEPTTRPVNFLGDNPGSRLIVLTDAKRPQIRLVFGGADVAREPLTIDVEEFIGVKSCKARGKRLTTFSVEKIEEMEPLPVPEDETGTFTPEETGASEEMDDIPSSDDMPQEITEKQTVPPSHTDELEMEIIVPMPEDSLPVDTVTRKPKPRKRTKSSDDNGEQMALF